MGMGQTFARVVLASALVTSCRRAPEITWTPLPAEVAGCAAIVEGPRCELPADRSVRVFVPGAGDPRAFVDDRPIVATTLRTFPDGKLLRFVLPEGAVRLRLEREGQRWSLELARAAYPWVIEARALRAKDPEAARAKATAALRSDDPSERALALGLLARLDLAKGNVDDAIQRFREALTLARGRVSDRAEDAFALSFAWSQRRGRYDEAKKVLDEIEPTLADNPEGRARLPYYRAQVQFQEGDLRAMLLGLHASQKAAARLGMVQLERNARGLLATVLQDLGDVDAGIATLRALDDELGHDASVTGCERVQTLLNLAMALDWRHEARRDLGEPLGADEVSAPAARALGYFPDACTDPHLHGLALSVSAVAALIRGSVDEAKALSTKAKAKMSSPRNSDVLESLHLDARIATRAGDHATARDDHAAAIALAEASHQTDMLWRALVGRGDALEALGDRKGALADFRRAEALVADVSLTVPLGDARGAYLGRSEASARRTISALLAEQKVDEAFAVARRARARLLSVTARALSVDALGPAARASWNGAVARFRAERAALDAAAEGDWKLGAAALADARAQRASKIASLRAALDDAMSALGPAMQAEAPLSPPRPGELWLAIGRSREGFLAFAATTSSVRFVRLPAASLDLSAFDAELRTAKQLVALPYGPFRAIDVHALSFDGAPIVERMPVVYALDVPTARAPADVQDLGLVADPTDDLPGARVEARSIEELWTSQKKPVHALRGPEAIAARVTSLLGTVGTLHYAGHGIFAGVEGTESRLPLAAGTQLGPLDVLAAPRVPRRVILSACESGRASTDALPETLGLAHAFVLAGSEGVVAPNRKVADALAARVSEALHAALLEGVDLFEALRRAQRTIRAEDASADWAAFRAMRP